MKTLTLTLMLLGSSLAYAQTATPAANAGSDKLDIRKLEQKYWSAKDDDFAVVQNRRYTKAKRFYLSANYGVPFNDPFNNGSILGFNFGYFFNERWGLDLEHKSASLKDNDAVTSFQSRFGAYPDHNTFTGSQILSISLVPFYAKMSFMDRSIIYFDMGLSIGGGTMSYKIKQIEGDITKSTAVVKFSVFQQIFFTEHLAVRADLTNTWGKQERAKYYNPGHGQYGYTDSRKLDEKTANDTSLLFGLTYWF